MFGSRCIFGCCGVWLLALCLPVLGTATAEAEVCNAYRTGRMGQQPVTVHSVATNGRRRIFLVNRPGAELATVYVVNTRILVDPQADYYRQGEGLIDENHHILAAQRLYRSLNARRVYIVRAQKRQAGEYAGEVIVPHMILLKPEEQKKRPIPVVPKPAATGKKRMAAMN